MASNLASITKLKTGQINSNSMSYLKDKNQIFIAHQKGLVVYDIKSSKFEDVKLGDSCKGQISCITTCNLLFIQLMNCYFSVQDLKYLQWLVI